MSNLSRQPDNEISRRKFVMAAAGCAAICACGGIALAAPADDKPIDVGPLSDYSKDGIDDKFVRSHSLFVIREDDAIFASTSICPHKGAALKVRNGEIYCPRHGSMFTKEGAVTKGPADTSLERYAISKNEAGHLIVDTTKSFREKNWTDPASFVKA